MSSSSDMGGTTTDIALLSGGRPVLNRDGATVGGFRTMVEAVGVHTFGLGGDSEVRLNEDGLIVGPRRVMPLSLLGHQHPASLAILRQHRRERRSGSAIPGNSRFASARWMPGEASLNPARS